MAKLLDDLFFCELASTVKAIVLMAADWDIRLALRCAAHMAGH
jgi:hypothetical protein